jgi:hypothetical protein
VRRYSNRELCHYADDVTAITQAIGAALDRIVTRVGKPLFPVRDPRPAMNVSRGGAMLGYQNTSYEVMAAALSELPVIVRCSCLIWTSAL